MSMKNSNDHHLESSQRPSDFVAQHLNLCANAVPKYGLGGSVKENKGNWRWLSKVSNLFFQMVLRER